MTDYTDPIQMLQVARYHTRLTGHLVRVEDDSSRAMAGWVCSCGEAWYLKESSLSELWGGLLWGRDLSNRAQILSYLNGEMESPSVADQGVCLLYKDPIEMVQNIRLHVLREGHEVECSDNPLGQSLGYRCIQCAADTSRMPRASIWYVGLLALKSLSISGVEADLLRGALQSPWWRNQLTDYLNRRGGEAPILARYKRPLVI